MHKSCWFELKKLGTFMSVCFALGLLACTPDPKHQVCTFRQRKRRRTKGMPRMVLMRTICECSTLRPTRVARFQVRAPFAGWATVTRECGQGAVPEMLFGKNGDDRWPGVSESLRTAIRALLHNELRPVVNEGSLRDREANLNSVTERWVRAQSGREVVAMKAGASLDQRWVVVFVEDDKGILRAHGTTLADALERALTLLALATGEKGPCDPWS